MGNSSSIAAIKLTIEEKIDKLFKYINKIIWAHECKCLIGEWADEATRALVKVGLWASILNAPLGYMVSLFEIIEPI